MIAAAWARHAAALTSSKVGGDYREHWHFWLKMRQSASSSRRWLRIEWGREAAPDNKTLSLSSRSSTPFSCSIHGRAKSTALWCHPMRSHRKHSLNPDSIPGGRQYDKKRVEKLKYPSLFNIRFRMCKATFGSSIFQLFFGILVQPPTHSALNMGISYVVISQEVPPTFCA